MYSEQLEQMIKSVIADGVITDKERAVLHKKAAAENVDADEIDVYVDGLVANKKPAEDVAEPDMEAEDGRDLSVLAKIATFGTEYYKMRQGYYKRVNRSLGVTGVQFTFMDVKYHSNNIYDGLGLLFSVSDPKYTKPIESATLNFFSNGEIIASLNYDPCFYRSADDFLSEPVGKYNGNIGSCAYHLDKDILKPLCEASNISLVIKYTERLYSDERIDEIALPEFQSYARYCYHHLVDRSCYKDAVFVGVTEEKDDSFVELIKEYLKHTQTKKKSDDSYEETDWKAQTLLRELKEFKLPTEKSQLDSFGRSLEENASYLSDVCSRVKNPLLPEVYEGILEKMNKAYDQCMKTYKREITAEEQQLIDRIATLQKSGQTDDIITIADIYPQHTEIQKWGTKKGSELNPVGKAVLAALKAIEAPTDKEKLISFMQTLEAQKDHLKELSRQHQLLNIGSGFLSNDLYGCFMSKGDKVIKQYFKNETDGYIGERLQKKAKNKKYTIIGVVAVVIIILLMILFF